MDLGDPYALNIASVLASDAFPCNGSTRNFRDESYGDSSVHYKYDFPLSSTQHFIIRESWSCGCASLEGSTVLGQTCRSPESKDRCRTLPCPLMCAGLEIIAWSWFPV